MHAVVYGLVNLLMSESVAAANRLSEAEATVAGILGCPSCPSGETRNNLAEYWPKERETAWSGVVSR